MLSELDVALTTAVPSATALTWAVVKLVPTTLTLSAPLTTDQTTLESVGVASFSPVTVAVKVVDGLLVT